MDNPGTHTPLWYSDRPPIFKFTGDIDRYPAGPTQFDRAMDEVGTRMISPGSPQAKGRVDRAAATFQDRLVTELRLAGAATITEAEEVLNSFLPRFNEKFGVQAEQSIPAYRRLEQSVPLNQNLVLQTPPQGVQGQHHQIQPVYPATVALQNPSYLRRVHRFVEIAASNATMPRTTACGNAGTVTLMMGTTLLTSDGSHA